MIHENCVIVLHCAVLCIVLYTEKQIYVIALYCCIVLYVEKQPCVIEVFLKSVHHGSGDACMCGRLVS